MALLSQKKLSLNFSKEVPWNCLQNMNVSSSHRRCSRNKVISTGKHLCWSLFWIKLKAFRIKRLQLRCFHVNIAKFLRTPILKNICKGCFCSFAVAFIRMISCGIDKSFNIRSWFLQSWQKPKCLHSPFSPVNLYRKNGNTLKNWLSDYKLIHGFDKIS